MKYKELPFSKRNNSSPSDYRCFTALIVVFSPGQVGFCHLHMTDFRPTAPSSFQVPLGWIRTHFFSGKSLGRHGVFKRSKYIDQHMAVEHTPNKWFKTLHLTERNSRFFLWISLFWITFLSHVVALCWTPLYLQCLQSAFQQIHYAIVPEKGPESG